MACFPLVYYAMNRTHLSFEVVRKSKLYAEISENTCTLICMTPGRSVMIAALLKFIGVVGQSDIFYECPTKNITVLDQISNRKYKKYPFGV